MTEFPKRRTRLVLAAGFAPFVRFAVVDLRDVPFMPVVRLAVVVLRAVRVAAVARGVQQEVTRALAAPEDFLDVPTDAADAFRKASGLFRDSADDSRPAFFVRDGNYLSARWPGDVHTFASEFSRMVKGRREPTL